MQIVWTTDIHLNFLRQPKAAKNFAEYLMSENPEAQGLIITGDISSGKVLERHLRELAEGWTKPFYFVLGNHDFYDSSWKVIDEIVTNLTKEIPHLHWLNQGFHEVDGHAICGVGGWYDAYHGNTNSEIELNDFTLIDELLPVGRYKPLLLDEIRKRAGFESDQLAVMLNDACTTKNDTIIVATHIPPYLEAAWHEGAHSDREWVPWFSSASTGAVIDIFSERNPDKKFIVLTGHSHGSGVYQRKENVTVFTGPAVYGFPDVSGVINTKERKLWAYNHLGKKVEYSYAKQ